MVFTITTWRRGKREWQLLSFHKKLNVCLFLSISFQGHLLQKEDGVCHSLRFSPLVTWGLLASSAQDSSPLTGQALPLSGFLTCEVDTQGLASRGVSAVLPKGCMSPCGPHIDESDPSCRWDLICPRPSHFPVEAPEEHAFHFLECFR